MSAEQARLEDYRDELVETVRQVGAQATFDLDPEWRDAALEGIRQLAASGEVFEAEDVRHLAGDPPSPNAIGAAFLTASQAGLIQSVGIRKAARIQRHGSWVRTWRGSSA